MKVYIFGNRDVEFDNKAFSIANILKKDFPSVEFIEVNINQDLPFDHRENIVIMDCIDRINDVVYINNFDINSLSKSSVSSVHDFDLGFQLKYLKKLGKLGKVSLIGLPMKNKIKVGDPNYKRIQSILRKLVAQDMQGS